MRVSRTRDTTRFVDASLDLGTLVELREVIGALAELSPEAAAALDYVNELRGACDRLGNLPARRRGELGSLIAGLEARLQ